MKLRFTKMHGLGNDFVVIDLVTQHCQLKPHHIRRLADRHLGVGCDQVLLIEPPQSPDVDFRYRIFNSDGSEVDQCGNGARCFARYVRDKKMIGKNVIDVETRSGRMRLHLQRNKLVTVEMGVPIFEPADIPLQADSIADCYDIEADGAVYSGGAVSMGNPHFVMTVDDVKTAPVATVGPLLESHPRFPERANIGFMQVLNREEIRLRVYERGAGETLACGSGACAAVVVGIRQGLLDRRVRCHLKHGYLNIEWQGDSHPVKMTGPATSVYEGEITLH